MSTSHADEEVLFNSARKIGDELERAAFLEANCPDPRVRTRLDALLAIHDREESFLRSPEEVYVPATPESPVTEGPGTIIGPYKLLQQIGEGGFGVVFMAEQTAPVRRKVALKVIKPGMDTRQVVARFEAERQALALMEHPHIARVLDAGATESGRPYFVMELVRGIPLTDFCDEHKLSPVKRLELFVDVCRAVQHAHQKGIIHRDLKPSNVLVTLHDGKPVIKVIDFGVAKATGQQLLTDKTLFTGFAQLIGTPLYMSPEQAELSGLDIDTRSDIYSLGVLLYELLTGSTPFDKQRLREAAFEEVRQIIREEEPPRPSLKLSSLGETLPSISALRRTEPHKLSQILRGELDWIVMKALEKQRDRRYETANSLAADVERFLNNEAVLACPPSLGYRFRKFAQRHRTSLATATLFTLVLLTATVVSTVLAVRARDAERLAGDRLTEVEDQKTRVEQQRDRAIAAEQLAEERLDEVVSERNRAQDAEVRAQQEAEIARAVNDFLRNDLLAQASPFEETDRDISLRTILDRAAVNIEVGFDGQPLVEAAIRKTIGDTYADLGLLEEAQAHLERALEIDAAHLPEQQESLLDTQNLLAMLYADQGRFDEAERICIESYNGRRDLLGENHRLTLGTRGNLGRVYMAQSRYVEAEQLFRALLEVQKRELGGDDLLVLTTTSNLATTCTAQGRHEEAVQLYEQVLELDRQRHHADHPDMLTLQGNMATALGRAGRRSDAINLLRKTREQRLRVMGSEHPATLNTQANLAWALQTDRQYGEAESLYRQTIEDRTRLLGPVHPATLVTVHNFGRMCQDQGRDVEAEELHRDNLKNRRRVFAADHPSIYESQSALAVAIFNLDRIAEAEKLQIEAVQFQRRTLGTEHATTLSNLRWLLRMHQDNRHVADAIELSTELARIDLGGRIIALQAACYLTWAGDHAGHRQLCERLLAEAFESEDPLMAERTAKCILIHPEIGEDHLERAAELIQQAVEGDSENRWIQLCLGLAEYRLGRFAEAMLPLNRASSSVYRECRALANSLRALASFHRNQIEQATRFLQLAEADLGMTPYVELQSPFSIGHDELAAWLVMREAQVQIRGVSESAGIDHLLAANRRLLEERPGDTQVSMHQAFMYVWFDLDEQHRTLCEQQFDAAASSDDPAVYERAARSCLILSDLDDGLLLKAGEALRRSFELGPDHTLLARFQLSAGIAAHRKGNYEESESLLTKALNSDNSLVRGAVLLHRAIARELIGDSISARDDFALAESIMPPPPDRTTANEAVFDRDRMMFWLAFDEARRVLAR